MTPLGKLSSLAGQILQRTGKSNRLDIDDLLFTERIATEQHERTLARKAQQIKRARKKKVEELQLELSVQAEE